MKKLQVFLNRIRGIIEKNHKNIGYVCKVKLLIALLLVTLLLSSPIPETYSLIPVISFVLFGALILALYEKPLDKTCRETDSQIVHAFSAAIEYKDAYTRGHSLRVASYARETAKHMGFSPEFIERVYIAGLLHDIGKIVIPENILQKPGALTAQERIQIKKHVELGVNILQEVEGLEDIVTMIADHHECWNGSGYPLGKIGRKSCLGGRILAISDAYDAMTSQRIYRSSIGINEACQELRRCSGSQFDPEVAEVFTKWHCD